ncbi:MAG: methylated-DNA--[protein]-cysteine S-methyltransferase [Candidatus Izemoplasmatales bacterium]
MNQAVISTSIGHFLVEENNRAIQLIKPTNESETIRLSLLTKQLKDELNEYFAGLRTTFTIPYEITGTSFQQAVLTELQKVKYGETISYKELASRSQNPNSSRAVGTVCKKNPLLFIIPCHRIIKSDGSYGSYALGRNIKKRLIELEKHSS